MSNSVYSTLDFNRIKPLDFCKRGYLQEANRRFFHPLGLSLVVITNEDGSEGVFDIVDRREDPNGCVFDFKDESHFDSDRIEEIKHKAKIFEDEWDARLKSRLENLGFTNEPLPE